MFINSKFKPQTCYFAVNITQFFPTRSPNRCKPWAPNNLIHFVGAWQKLTRLNRSRNRLWGHEPPPLLSSRFSDRELVSILVVSGFTPSPVGVDRLSLGLKLPGPRLGLWAEYDHLLLKRLDSVSGIRWYNLFIPYWSTSWPTTHWPTFLGFRTDMIVCLTFGVLDPEFDLIQFLHILLSLFLTLFSSFSLLCTDLCTSLDLDSSCMALDLYADVLRKSRKG